VGSGACPRQPDRAKTGGRGRYPQSDLVHVPEVVSKREEGRVVELGSGQCARELEVACQQLACWCGGRSEGRWQEKVVVRWPAWPFSHFPFLEFLQPLHKLIQGKARENL
jgi:hypothetical protein